MFPQARDNDEQTADQLEGFDKFHVAGRPKGGKEMSDRRSFQERSVLGQVPKNMTLAITNSRPSTMPAILGNHLVHIRLFCS